MIKKKKKSSTKWVYTKMLQPNKIHIWQGELTSQAMVKTWNFSSRIKDKTGVPIFKFLFKITLEILVRAIRQKKKKKKERKKERNKERKERKKSHLN